MPTKVCASAAKVAKIATIAPKNMMRSSRFGRPTEMPAAIVKRSGISGLIRPPVLAIASAKRAKFAYSRAVRWRLEPA